MIEIPAYKAYFGRDRQDGSGTQWLAAYTVRGFETGAAADTNRFEQIMAIADELVDADGANRLEILRSRQKKDTRAIPHAPQQYATSSGLTAELIAYADEAGNMVPMDPPETGFKPGAFHESIFCYNTPIN